MRLELASLERSDGKFSQIYEPDQLAIDEGARLIAPFTVTGRVSRARGKVVLAGSFETQTEIECDRCLKHLLVPVNARFRVEYVTRDAYEAMNAVELSDSDMTLSVFDGEAIDLDELVREQLLLALPSRILCRDECKGLCPICGIDRNVANCDCEATETDPRWGALKELVNGKS